MEPAKTIIAKLGGVSAVAEAAGVHFTRVYRWQWPSERGGTGGHIPRWHIPALIEYAGKTGVDLSPSDFAPVPEKQEG